MHEIVLETTGFGIILYSPTAVTHIPEGSNYLQEQFSQPEQVARHLTECELTALCTGSPGSFRIRFLDGPPNDSKVQVADFKLRLGLLVRDGTVCVRDLFDLMDWHLECPRKQCVPVADGWYRLTVFSSRPHSGILGDNQVININLEAVASKPRLRWDGVPQLCE